MMICYVSGFWSGTVWQWDWRHSWLIDVTLLTEWRQINNVYINRAIYINLLRRTRMRRARRRKKHTDLLPGVFHDYDFLLILLWGSCYRTVYSWKFWEFQKAGTNIRYRFFQKLNSMSGRIRKWEMVGRKFLGGTQTFRSRSPRGKSCKNISKMKSNDILKM